jgi:cytochrome d ubiquinol oxidase subunit I
MLVGSWLSGFFIIVGNAWMQHPVAYTMQPDGSFDVASFWGVSLNPWALLEYAHTMGGAVVTAAFVMAAAGAYYLLERVFVDQAQIFVRVGVVAGVIACVAQIFPTGDAHGRYMAVHQPVTTAAMEGLFTSESGAPIVILGQPDAERQTIDNPLVVNRALSFLIYGTTTAQVKGLNEFPMDQWPTNIPLLYFSYHIMAGLGTIFVVIMGTAACLLWRERLARSRWMLWILMLSAPFPYIANTAGWMTAEVGRQPWTVYGLTRTAAGYSPQVHAGNGLFTLLGFMGMYTVLAVLFLFLTYREMAHGPA